MSATNVESPNKLEQEKQLLRDAKAQGRGAEVRAWVRLSGPGWLQSAITLGGGSLATGMYLGVLAGYGMLWLQPFAMILGVIMLSGIAYVTLSTGERPFRAINKHINPVLGWSWALASLLANMVWCLPQFALANGVIQQNLAPELLGGDGGKFFICVAILVVTVGITWCYGSGGWGIRFYELVLKLMVAGIVISFFGVVIKMTSTGALSWGEILSGFIPDFSRFSRPAEGFVPLLDTVPEAARAFWTQKIVASQRDVMIGAAATAVGINMTFLLPYSMLARKWDKDFRGLAIFDLATGMFIPFVLATSCVVIAAASQFHLEPAAGLLNHTNEAAKAAQPAAGTLKEYRAILTARVKAVSPAALERAAGEDQFAAVEAEVNDAERRLAAMLVHRDVRDLAQSLQRLTGPEVANWVFGLGVLGMALSTITILMLISGFVICEMLNLPAQGWPFRLGTLAAATGVLGPFLWTQAAAYLAVPTSVFGMVLLPVAYISFLLLMNQKELLGENRPQGAKLVLWNVLLGIAAGVATLASLFVVHQKAGVKGWIGVGALLALALAVQIARKVKK